MNISLKCLCVVYRASASSSSEAGAVLATQKVRTFAFGALAHHRRMIDTYSLQNPIVKPAFL